ncbi:MAG: integrase [Acidobacteria bacterium]|nr:MAG: integrase [Acidobacteriota bacterium]
MTEALAVPTPFDRVRQLVLDAVSSPLTRVMYAHAITEFEGWWQDNGRPPFVRATVQSYRSHLESRGLAPSSVNQRLSALRKLAREAAYNGLLDPVQAQAIRDVKGARIEGTRTGNWLTKKQAEALINKPGIETLKGKRDRAMLAVMIGCGLRRDEVARLGFENIRQLDGRWCVADLRGKHGRVRTVPMPSWCKAAIDQWAAAAGGLTSGAVFRGVNKGDNITGESLTSQGVWRCVAKYSDIAPHDLRRTYAKLAHKGGAKLDQIQLSLGHASLTTTERYLGIHQDLGDAPCDYIRLDLSAAEY